MATTSQWPMQSSCFRPRLENKTEMLVTSMRPLNGGPSPFSGELLPGEYILLPDAVPRRPVIARNGSDVAIAIQR